MKDLKKLLIIYLLLLSVLACNKKATKEKEERDVSDTVKQETLSIEIETKEPQIPSFQGNNNFDWRWAIVSPNSKEEKNDTSTGKKSSWIKIISNNFDNLEFYDIPGKDGSPISNVPREETETGYGYYPTQKNQYVHIDDIKTIEGKTYFHMAQSFNMYLHCEGFINTWISEDDAIEIPDFFLYTLEQVNPQKGVSLLDFVNKSIGGNLNVTETQIKEVEMLGGIPEGRYYMILCKQGYRTPEISLFVAQYENNFKLLHTKEDSILEFDALNPEEGGTPPKLWSDWHTESFIKIRDIDNNGNSEFIEMRFLGPEKITLLIYQFREDEYKPIFDIYIDGRYTLGIKDWEALDLTYIVLFKHGYSDENQMTYIRFFNWYPNLPKFSEDFSGGDIRVFKLTEGRYKEIDRKITDLDYQTIFDNSLPDSPYLYDNTGNTVKDSE